MKINSKRPGQRFVRYFDPVIRALKALGDSGRPSEVVKWIIDDLSLTEAVQNELTKGGQLRLPNDIAWARFYLVKAGLVENSDRGVCSLTPTGQNAALTDLQADELFKQVHSQWKASR